MFFYNEFLNLNYEFVRLFNEIILLWVQKRVMGFDNVTEVDVFDRTHKKDKSKGDYVDSKSKRVRVSEILISFYLLFTHEY